MTKKEKTRPGAPTPGQAVEMSASRAAFPVSNFNTAPAGRQLKISDFLGRSRESAVTCRQLCAWTDLDNRSVRLLIEAERRRGVPILSDSRHGYWVSNSKTEIEHFCVGMRQRAFEIQKTAAFVRLATLEMDDDE